MLSNENFILAPLEIKKARERLLISSVFIFSILYYLAQVSIFMFGTAKYPHTIRTIHPLAFSGLGSRRPPKVDRRKIVARRS